MTLGTSAYIGVRSLGIDPRTELVVMVASGVWIATVAAFLVYIRWFHNPAQYEILKATCTLLVEAVGSHHRYTYTKIQKVRALRRNLRLVEFKAHWTGQSSKGKLRVEPVYGNHVVLDGYNPEEDGRVHRWVYPGTPVGRGHILTVGIEHVHEDDMGQQRPYFRDGGGAYRAKKLTVVVRFPLGEEPSDVSGGVWNTHLPVGQNNYVGSYPSQRVLSADGRIVDHVVVVKRPKRHHSYGLRWTWARRRADAGAQ